MVSLDDKVRALAVTAGWKSPRPGHGRDSLLRKVAGQQAGICRERASVVALERQEDAAARGLDGERLILQSRVPVDVPQQEFDDAVRDFLNDLAWWKKSLGDSPREELPPMFSMPGTFFGGVY